MNQRTDTWLAIRAITSLEDEAAVPDLVKILKPQAEASAIGSWIPDLQDTKIASGDIDNHIFKLEPWDGANKRRYVLSKNKLSKKLGRSRQMGTCIKGRAHWLDSGWWNESYKATPGAAAPPKPLHAANNDASRPPPVPMSRETLLG